MEAKEPTVKEVPQSKETKPLDPKLLKRKFKALQKEYTKVLESWEEAQKKVQLLTKERALLRAKLETFFKT